MSTEDSNEKLSGVTVPSNPVDRKKLKQILVEMTNCMQRADLEKESMKELASDAERQFEIPKKLIKKLATTMYKRSYATLSQEQEDFERLYEVLVEGKMSEVEDKAA